MTVRTWKRIITVTVILVILILLATTISFAVRYGNLEDQYQSIVNDDSIVDLADYGYIDATEMAHLFEYLGHVDTNGSLEYQEMYPDLYVDNDFVFTDTSGGKVCYLTFDDGPNSDVTAQVLDVLKEYNVKATFFVVYKDSKAERALYQRIVDEGHTIGIHTASHDYNKIYASVEAYLDDFDRCSRQVENVTGVKPEIFRFPGGSVNGYNGAIYRELISEMVRRGYTYYDWNASSGDAASSNVPVRSIINNCVNTATDLNHKILLLHDGSGHQNTADALPQVIKGLLEQGYEFRALTNDVAPVCFGY